ncbi:hypothetical protein DSECCO2_587220 [anaerobic digester metagenome]
MRQDFLDGSARFASYQAEAVCIHWIASSVAADNDSSVSFAIKTVDKHKQVLDHPQRLFFGYHLCIDVMDIQIAEVLIHPAEFNKRTHQSIYPTEFNGFEQAGGGTGSDGSACVCQVLHLCFSLRILGCVCFSDGKVCICMAAIDEHIKGPVQAVEVDRVITGAGAVLFCCSNFFAQTRYSNSHKLVEVDERPGHPDDRRCCNRLCLPLFGGNDGTNFGRGVSQHLLIGIPCFPVRKQIMKVFTILCISVCEFQRFSYSHFINVIAGPTGLSLDA